MLTAKSAKNAKRIYDLRGEAGGVPTRITFVSFVLFVVSILPVIIQMHAPNSICR